MRSCLFASWLCESTTRGVALGCMGSLRRPTLEALHLASSCTVLYCRQASSCTGCSPALLLPAFLQWPWVTCTRYLGGVVSDNQGAGPHPPSRGRCSARQRSPMYTFRAPHQCHDAGGNVCAAPRGRLPPKCSGGNPVGGGPRCRGIEVNPLALRDRGSLRPTSVARLVPISTQWLWC